MTGNIRVKVARRRRHQGDDVVEILDAADHVIVTGEAGLGDEGLDLIDLTEEPDVIVLDLDVAGPEALEATRRIATEHPSARLLVLTTSDDEDDLDEAVRVGARGYVVKPARRSDLVDAVRLVAAGHMVIDARFAGRPIPKRPPERLARGTARERMLTEREVEILALLSSGRSDEDVAEHLGVTSATVRRNLARICTKLEVPDREAAIARASLMGVPSRGRADLVWIREVPRSEDEDRI